MSLLKKIINVIQTPLLHIFNRFLATGTVPCKFKIAQAIPIYKSGDTADINNYHPISSISNFCNKMGITGTELLWFKNYLTDRKQYVKALFQTY